MKAVKRCLILVVLGLFFLILAVNLTSAQTPGCYIYPGAEEGLYCGFGITQEIAQEDCVQYPDCEVPGKDFLVGQDCSQLVQCQQIICNVNCQPHSISECQALGGDSVEANGLNFEYWCSSGCCILPVSTGSNECLSPAIRWECTDIAAKKDKLGDFIPFSPAGISPEACQQCQIDLKPIILNINIVDQNGISISADFITINGINQGENFNLLKFTSALPGTFIIEVEKAGYSISKQTITLVSGEEKSLEIQLFKLIISALGSIKVNLNVEGVTLTWNGPVSGKKTISTTEDTLVNFPLGIYTLTFTKSGYKPKQEKVTLSSSDDFPIELNLILEKSTSTKIKGVTIVEGKSTPEVDIYLDGLKKTKSLYTLTGGFELELEVKQINEPHTLFASYLQTTGNSYNSKTVYFELDPQQPELDLGLIILEPKVGECDLEAKDVSGFSGYQVKGKKEILLQWLVPCVEVLSYDIIRTETKTNQEVTFTVYPPLLADEKVDWDTQYTYSIVANYKNSKKSPTPSKITISIGDEECEGHFNFATGINNHFCLAEENGAGDSVPDLGQSSDQRSLIYTCVDQGSEGYKLTTLTDCSADLGQGYYCSSSGEGRADCKSNFFCAGGLGSSPLGLYSSFQQCYGLYGMSDSEITNLDLAVLAEGTENYCYLDYTSSAFDQCSSCLTVKNCFDYQGKSACEFNNCLTTQCKWVDAALVTDNKLVNYDTIPTYNDNSLFTTAETGTGYCVENWYEGDKCSLCGPNSGIFENYYCTADVCSSLGRCLSNPPYQAGAKGDLLSSCSYCEEYPHKDSVKDTTCYAYQTEQECTGGQSITKTNEKIIESGDSCSWGRCAWTGTNCIKDGDADEQDDCSSFTGIERTRCAKDITPPTTTLSSDSSASLARVITKSNPNITFISQDKHIELSQQSGLGSLKYCLTSLEIDTCSQFVEVSYPPSVIEGEISIDLLSDTNFKDDINGKTYKLKYFSSDSYDNQEQVNEQIVILDNVVPNFKITAEHSTFGATTELKVFLEEVSELMGCEFNLKSVTPAGEFKVQSKTRLEEKQVIFPSLSGVRYNLSVECEDDYGNVNHQSEMLVFDLEPKIEVIYPPLGGVLNQTTIAFQAATDLASVCDLYSTLTGEKLASFMSSQQEKMHTTSPLPNYFEDNYAGNREVRCRELLTNELYVDYFDFEVDFTPPETFIVLQEGLRIEQPITYGWEKYFLNGVNVSFNCDSQGFACAQTFYCLGKGCSFAASPNYQAFTSQVILTQSASICYYSTDVAGNKFPKINCGKIIIDGYGLVLEKPSSGYYLGELWGVSSNPLFDWQFYTKVPTTECKFDFAPGFDYEDIPGFKVLTLNSDNRYSYLNFPEGTGFSFNEQGGVRTIYVRCKNMQGDIGSSQKINLEFDPSAPKITSFEVNPKILIDGTKVALTLNTDDKTNCKYSDSGHTDYDSMPFYFPGAKDKLMDIEHKDMFSVNSFTGLVKEFSLNAVCRNGAGLESEVETATFKVDYTQAGGILSIIPYEDFFMSSPINVKVETSKNALCEYKVKEYFIPLSGYGGKVHTVEFTNLAEGYYEYPLRCIIEDQIIENKTSFTIDKTPPKITSINDGAYTCGKEELKVMVYTDGEKKIQSYNYELYNRGSVNVSGLGISGLGGSSLGAGVKELILSGTKTDEESLTIKISDLKENNKYALKVQATDAAGNVGQWVESDGFTVSKYDEFVCVNDESAPNLEIVKNSLGCNLIEVQLLCTDETICQITYALSMDKEDCVPDINYSLGTITVKETNYLCYTLEDGNNNSYTAIEKIEFADDDGDGVLDECDSCLETDPGKIADFQGCAEGQFFTEEKHSDKDNLPDLWEQQYDSLGCELDYLQEDSDKDGITDEAEDYDGDGYKNYQEYSSGTNPCIPDEPRPSKDLDEGDLEIPPFAELLDQQPNNTLAWIFLILGWLLVIGGTGYLIYYYTKGAGAASARQSSGRITGLEGSRFRVSTENESSTIGLKPLSAGEGKVLSSRRERASRERGYGRKELFSSFNKGSKEIPHVEEALKSKKPILDRLDTLAGKYLDNKEEIKKGLGKEEKDLFSKLELISKDTKAGKLDKAAASKKAQDVFSELKKISQKRKEK
ncbi:MAG TPA: hypothetical protein VJC39_03865 [Candidatus Nanoarchaeia archaeon]|nr:hypothetical protein [Candidatus Nanoarchaeia archaeon]